MAATSSIEHLDPPPSVPADSIATSASTANAEARRAISEAEVNDGPTQHFRGDDAVVAGGSRKLPVILQACRSRLLDIRGSCRTSCTRTQQPRSSTLERTFGFELRLSQTGAAGRSHNELILGDDGLVMLGQAGEGFSSPRTLDVLPPSMIHVYVDDVEALHKRATDAGAEVTDLELSPVGDRRFTATDPEGQLWVFAQRIRSTERSA